MRSGLASVGCGLAALGLVHCAAAEPPVATAVAPARSSEVTIEHRVAAPKTAPSASPSSSGAAPTAAGGSGSSADPAADPSLPTSSAEPGAPSEAPALEGPPTGGTSRCASVPPLGPDGAVPPPPPHTPVGVDIEVPGDRPAYVLPGNPGDSRLIVYLHGMCGDVAAADHFRDAVRAHGTLVALRGDSRCTAERFKWRDAPDAILRRLRAALARVSEAQQVQLELEGAVLFGYSQGADRAEKLAGRFPQLFRRIVLGGPPMKASPVKLARAERVAILGGELETTEKMRAGAEALQTAGIACRFFALECAYHGYYGIRAEAQLGEVLDWVSGN